MDAQSYVRSAMERFDRSEKAFKKMFAPKKETAKLFSLLHKEIRSVESRINEAENKRRAVRITNKPTAEDKRSARLLEKQNEKLRVKQIQDARREKERNEFIQRQEFRKQEYRPKETKFETRIIDQSKLVPLRLDRNTVIYIKPDKDPEAVLKKFRERNND